MIQFHSIFALDPLNICNIDLPRPLATCESTATERLPIFSTGIEVAPHPIFATVPIFLPHNNLPHAAANKKGLAPILPWSV